METFFATLKGELIEEADCPTRDDARAELFHDIEGIYNQRRLHPTLGYLTPKQKALASHPAASAA
jgi:transposase InsO family protein